jgi:hypothetical protein
MLLSSISPKLTWSPWKDFGLTWMGFLHKCLTVEVQILFLMWQWKLKVGSHPRQQELLKHQSLTEMITAQDTTMSHPAQVSLRHTEDNGRGGIAAPCLLTGHISLLYSSLENIISLCYVALQAANFLTDSLFPRSQVNWSLPPLLQLICPLRI